MALECEFVHKQRLEGVGVCPAVDGLIHQAHSACSSVVVGEGCQKSSRDATPTEQRIHH